ncbi:MAG: 50S ribosomal protein L18 [Bacteroidia bacterium]|jgi:large subunit ribosomal protein L18|nr:50S ribosomal protein L18 [Bacteroidia bacterium]
MAKSKVSRRNKIRKRIRGVVTGTAARPRLSVYRSNKDIYVQLIDDTAGVTLASASSRVAEISDAKETKVAKAEMVGKKIAELAKAAGINSVVFDRGGYLYHGRVKSLADGAREGGLEF